MCRQSPRLQKRCQAPSAGVPNLHRVRCASDRSWPIRSGRNSNWVGCGPAALRPARRRGGSDLVSPPEKLACTTGDLDAKNSVMKWHAMMAVNIALGGYLHYRLIFLPYPPAGADNEDLKRYSNKKLIHVLFRKYREKKIGRTQQIGKNMA